MSTPQTQPQTKKKAEYILTEHKNGGWITVDAFELQLTGEEHLLCHIIWKTRKDIIAAAEKSIHLKFIFREPVYFPGIGREQIVNVGSPIKDLEKDWGMHPRDFVQEGNAEERATELAKKSEMMAFRIPRNEGMKLFSSLLWVCNSSGAKPESVSSSGDENEIIASMTFFDSVVSDNMDVTPDKIVATGFNKLQLKIIRTIIEGMVTNLPKNSVAQQDWKNFSESTAGQKIFQLQELIMLCFPDPLDEMKDKEMANAAKAIQAKKDNQDKESSDDENLW